jgi:hypothetical protein
MEPHLYEYRYWCSGYILHISGGTKAVNVTQKQQMFVIMSGMLITFSNSAFYQMI